ncbi:MAG: amidohydrolase family protein [Candidatus Bathyarchaeota archaeon]|nr:MAG: amidohydrolase family protein [Candidatus Bathyarchaeota archaeon]
MKNSKETVELRVGKLIVGNGTVREDTRIGIVNGRILEISDKPLTHTYENVEDVMNRIVMPGLIDAHVHLVYSGRPQDIDIRDRSHEYLTLRAAELSRKALKAGVTTLADAGGRGNTIFALRNAIKDGITLGPRIRACGSMITITGGRATHGFRVRGGYEVDGADEARKKTRELLMYYGADLIKLGATGALSSPHTGARDPQLTVTEMQAAVEEAHKCGRPVHAHCYGPKGISNALDANVDVIVHGQTLNKTHIKDMKQLNTILIPTLTVFRRNERVKELATKGEAARPISSESITEQTEMNVRNAIRHGIPIAMGTDSGMTHTYFGDNLLDLVYMVDWGMQESEAIVAGTLTAAKALRIDDQVGSIETGKLADLLILKQDPLKDIKVLTEPETIQRIMLNGRFIEHLLI